jgi:hypothetical protein
MNKNNNPEAIAKNFKKKSFLSCLYFKRIIKMAKIAIVDLSRKRAIGLPLKTKRSITSM